MYILGINCAKHDSSACLLEDGKLVFAIAEERLSRVKKDNRFPWRSIRACLDYKRLNPQDLDYICFSWNKPGMTGLQNIKAFIKYKPPLTKGFLAGLVKPFLKDFKTKGGLKPLRKQVRTLDRKKIFFVDHHLAHVLSAYPLSGFNKASVLVVDGRGAFQSTTLGYATQSGIKIIKEFEYPNSLGNFYANFTNYLGFKPNRDEWKVMGLSAYGEPVMPLDDLLWFNETDYRVNVRNLVGRFPWDKSSLARRFGPFRYPESELTERHQNIAASLQKTLEDVMQMLTSTVVSATKCRDLCLAGGVGLNSKANGKLIRSGLIDNIFIQPAATDDGSAIGAAFYPYLLLGLPLPLDNVMKDVYLGPSFSEAVIEKTLRKYKISYQRYDNIEEIAADLIAKGNIIGWFQGRMEFGPRALGNRSILADPRDADMKDKVNSSIKFREYWRPFAASILAESAQEFLENYYPSPFMILTFQVPEDKRHKIPAVVHVDGSTRPQTVEKEVNPKYWRLIKYFESITGVPAVLNTSFNLRGEPIVCTPEDAIKTFYTSGMDCLIMENFLIRK